LAKEEQKVPSTDLLSVKFTLRFNQLTSEIQKGLTESVGQVDQARR